MEEDKRREKTTWILLDFVGSGFLFLGSGEKTQPRVKAKSLSSPSQATQGILQSLCISPPQLNAHISSLNEKHV